MPVRKPTEGSGANDQADSALEQILASLGQPNTGQVPTRYIFENGQVVAYDGPGLVNTAGQIEQEGPYAPDYAPFLYNSLSPANQDALVAQLEKAGFIEQSQFGDSIAEITAIGNLLLASNANGITYRNYLGQKLAGKTTVSSGGGRTYQTTNPDDLKVVAKQVAQQTLGRGFTDEEADRFVKVFQAQEIAEQRRAAGGGTMVQAPSADVAAEKFAEEQAPTEASAYKTLGYINKFFNAIGGV
jgi:hypothetical protein